MSCYFTADLHLGHSNILKYCRRTSFMNDEERDLLAKGVKFRISEKTTKRMDDALIEIINSLVGTSDELWILGDFCFCRQTRDYLKTVHGYRSRIKCRNTNIVFGNHDRRAAGDVFQNACELTSVKIDKWKIVLSHYPFAIWDARHFGSINLYGHSHGRAEPWLDKVMPGRFAMDVGVDNAFKLLGEYRPFVFEEIKTIMEQRSGFGLLNNRAIRTPEAETGL